MERPEFGLVGSLSRLVDEERACGGVEQGLLRTSSGKSQTFGTVARCASPRLGARASECVSRGTTQFGNWHIAISRHTQRRGPKMGSGGLGRPVSGFRLRPRESRKAGARPGRGARPPSRASSRAPPVSRACPLFACCVSQSRGVGAEHFTTAAVPPTPARTRTATRRPPRRVRGRSRTPRTWPTARAAHPPPPPPAPARTGPAVGARTSARSSAVAAVCRRRQSAGRSPGRRATRKGRSGCTARARSTPRRSC